MKILAFLLGTILSSAALAQQVPNPVSGPNSATPGNLPVFQGTTGKVLMDSGVKPVEGVPPTLVSGIAFWNTTNANKLTDRGWQDDNVRLTAPMNRSLTLQGTGGLQLGGPTGPFIMNDTALDTISVQAQPGAGPSGDTTNFQIYPPRDGDKAFVNIVAKAVVGGAAAEERLIIGSMGAAERAYHFSQIVAGPTAQCRDVIFKDGVSTGPAWTLKCGNPTTAQLPQLQLGYGVPISSQHPSLVGQSMLYLDSGNNQVMGEGSAINTLVFKKTIGSFGPSPSLASCGTSPVLTAATNTKGLVTVGTGSPTTCTVVFSTPYSSTPAVVLTGVNTLGLNFWLSDINPSGFTFAAGDGAVPLNGAGVIYHVIQ